MQSNKITTIGTIFYFNTNKKIHIQKELGTMETMCGKNLGFDYEVNNEQKTFSNFLKHTDGCKKCQKAYEKANK